MNPVLVALDVPELDEAVALARTLSPHVGGYKVGLELLMGHGPPAVAQVAALGLPVFVDAKLHDIPNTVEAAARRLAASGARWVTVHASGGSEMMEAAAVGLHSGTPQAKAGVLAVTVLTSIDEDDLAQSGISGPLEAQVRRLAGLAAASGAEGVICSPHEVRSVKAASDKLLAVTPGIRRLGDEAGDQKRVASPVDALEMGSDYLVVGRSITRAHSPPRAAMEIAEAIETYRGSDPAG